MTTRARSGRDLAKPTECGMSDKLTTTFDAILPDIAGAIQLHGGGGMRVRFDIDETNVPAALLLTLMRDKLLRVTVEATKHNDDG